MPVKDAGKGHRSFICAILATFIVGAVLVYVAHLLEDFHWPRALHGLVLELGLGFVVGGIVAITIEWYLRQRAGKEAEEREAKIRQNVFEALFETAVPRELVGEMYHALIYPKFRRQHLVIELALDHLPPGQAPGSIEPLLVGHQSFSFQALNMTDRRASYRMQPREEVLVPHNKYDLPFTEFFMQGSHDKIHLKNDELKAHVGLVSDSQMRYSFLHEQVVEVEPKGRANVRFTGRKLFRYADTETWVTRNAADKLKLRVSLEQGLFETLEFCVDEAHRQELVPAKPQSQDGRMILSWELPYPILPYQGVMLRWRPRNPQTVGAASGTSA